MNTIGAAATRKIKLVHRGSDGLWRVGIEAWPGHWESCALPLAYEELLGVSDVSLERIPFIRTYKTEKGALKAARKYYPHLTHDALGGG